MEIREKILEGAGNLFIEHGVRLITMDNIAQSLGVSKRTIYENFRDKNDLLTNFLINAILEHKKSAMEIMNNAKNVIEALFLFDEYNQKIFKKINPCFFEDIKKYYPEVFKRIMNSGEIRNSEISYMILKRGINEGVFIKEIDIEIANLFFHYIMQFFRDMEGKKFNHRQIWVSVHLPYLRGICTEKGRDLINSFVYKAENLNDF